VHQRNGRHHLKTVGLDNGHDVVVHWGRLIHTNFVRDNAHLLTTSSSDSTDKELLQCINLKE